MLEANQRRRALLQQQARARWMNAGVAARSGATWTREHLARLLMAATAVVLLGMAGMANPSPMTDDEPKRAPIVASPGDSEVRPASKVTATLTLAGPAGDAEPDPESAGEGEPDATPADETADAHAADARAESSPTRDQAPQTSTETSQEVAPSTEPVPAPVPELSDTGETEDGSESEPEAESPEEETPDDDDADAGDGMCVGINALGLTVDLCVPSLLE